MWADRRQISAIPLAAGHLNTVSARTRTASIRLRAKNMDVDHADYLDVMCGQRSARCKEGVYPLRYTLRLCNGRQKAMIFWKNCAGTISAEL